jgi:hypothetical protein
VPAAGPRVVYIAGWGRSGSSVLEQVLGEIDGWFSCGELNLIWWNQTCGCGVPVFECDFWKPIIDDLRARHPDLEPQEVIAFQERLLGPRPSSLVGIARDARRAPDDVTPRRSYSELLTELYAGAAERAGARVLVDSSKTATDAYLLAALTDADLYVVHLVRDPRATAFAWAKRKAKSYDPLLYFGRMGAARNSFRWLRRNGVVEALLRRRLGSRYMLLRYEDFVADPPAAVRSICGLAGRAGADLSFLDGRRARTSPNHTVSGNPSRLQSGELEISPDDAWKSGMTPRAKGVAAAVAAPLMARYGYPFFRTPRSRHETGGSE